MTVAEEEKACYTMGDVAERWGCNRMSVLRAIRNGVLRAFDANTQSESKRRHWLIRREDLLAFEEARMNRRIEQ